MKGSTANGDGGEEAARIRALHDLHALDGPTDARFDRIARLAALTFEAPRAAVVLVDKDRLFLKGQFGVGQRDHPRAGSLADIMVSRAQVTICRDITRDAAFKALWPSLTQVNVRFFACAPLITPGGEVVGLLSLGDPKPHREVTPAQRQALVDLAAMAMEELLRDAELVRRARRLDIAVEAGGLAEFEWEVAADRLVIGPRAAAVTGLPEGVALNARQTILHGPLDAADREHFSRAVRQALTGRAGMDVEFSWTRPDSGRPICLSVRAVRLEDGDPAVQRLVGVLQDVTQRRQEDQRREALAGELDHRVKNMLAVIQSVANQSARKTTSLDAFLKTFTGRLKAMASAHELLTATRWAGAYLRDVAAAELGGLAPGQIDSGGPELYLTPRAASAVALALHELAANALRHGALSEDRGRVTVRWSATPAGGFVLDWRESGGPAARPDAGDGFGGVLLSEITGRELDGHVTLEPSPAGLKARIEAAASALALPPSEAAEPAPRRTADAPAQVLTLQSDPGNIAGLKILIVEDSLLLALELEQGLTDLGAHIVGTAAEVSEAMAMIDRPFDAAVLDANLNGASVMPVAEALHAMGRPFIFATGYADKAGPTGFDAPVVRKPYNVGQIARALAQACAQPKTAEPAAPRSRVTGLL
jgi:two-component sensor histidine kinase/PAS domain-containing protein/ActR/RegA family two-component response regulator